MKKCWYNGKEVPCPSSCKRIEDMDREELNVEFRRRAANCGGCNQVLDIEDSKKPN